MTNSICGDLTDEVINYIYVRVRKNKNRKKIKYIIDVLSELIFSDIKPYLYTILAILVLMFLMNCFNFYYYIKLFMKSNPKFSMNEIADTIHTNHTN